MDLTYETLLSEGRKLYEHFQQSLKLNIDTDRDYAEKAAGGIVDRLVGEMMLEVVGDVYKAIKLGYEDVIFSRINDNSIEEKNVLFYPVKEIGKTEDINCPKCSVLLHATRFTGHLEKCMGLGRSSFRVASERIANNSYAILSDDDDDDRKTKKPRYAKKLESKKKSPARKQKPYKPEVSKNLKEVGNSPSTSKDIFRSANSSNKVAQGVNEEMANIFLSRCGVKSDHTGKYCGRSLRCPLHTDEERAVTRKIFAAETMEISDYTKGVVRTFSQIDITQSTPTSKKKEKQKHSTPKY